MGDWEGGEKEVVGKSGSKPRRLGEQASEERLRKGERVNGVRNKEKKTRSRERGNNGVASKREDER